MFYFGVDYYPEQWPEERWPFDACLMQEAGINVVRLAEFAWSKMEPEEGHFDFDWLDRAISILNERGILVILGTPTASAPPWLLTRHPDIFRMLQNGLRETYGNRRNYCPNHPTYREFSRRITSRMADHYQSKPMVVGWQVDNEFGQGDRCCCPICIQGFHDWLARRYGSIGELNQKWGTVFWSHVYNDWSEIPAPLSTGNSPNPGLALDYYRFASDSWVSFQKLQVDILREKCPDQFVTHNFMGFQFGQLDYFDLAEDLDFVSYDIYPRTQWAMQMEVDPSAGALGHDSMRGLKRKNHWVMEQQAGPGGWEQVSVMPRPGELRLWAYQSIAHGADAVIFFRWRTARFGTEEYWHGLLDHHGRPGRRYEEIQRMGHEIARIGERIYGSQVKAPVAFLQSFDSRFAFQIQPNNPQFIYPRHFQDVYRGFYQHNAGIDVISPESELSGYRLVVAPALHVVTDPFAEKLKRFVSQGGTLMLTARSGVKDEANAVIDLPLPGFLAELCGVEVEEYDSLPEGAKNQLVFEQAGLVLSQPIYASVWCDVLRPSTASVVARYCEDYYAGKPAITLNRYGAGNVIYAGVLGEGRLFEHLAKLALDLAGVEAILPAPEGVEIANRWQDGQRLTFVLNHTDQEQRLWLERPFQNLLSDSGGLQGEVMISPHEVWILTENIELA